MTTLALPALDGTTIHGWYATLGAVRILAGRWPGLTLHWDQRTPVLTGGPATVEEAAEAIHADTICRVPEDGVLPDCNPAYPPAGRGWYGHLRTADDPDAAWPAGIPEMWQAALTSPSGMWLHPAVTPHAAQTVRGMLAVMVRALRADPDLLRQALAGLGLTTAYPGGLWLLRHECDGRGNSASPGRDWLTILALPWLPARDHDTYEPGMDVAERYWRAAVGWRYRRTATGRREPVAEWWLWPTPVPASAVPALLAAPQMVPQPAVRCGAVREPRTDPRTPPYVRSLRLDEVRVGRLDDHEVWSVADVARLAGIKPGTLRGYVTRGQAPAYDEPGGWLPATIRPWLARQRQPGARTDRAG